MFVVFEGIDGSGKSSLIEKVKFATNHLVPDVVFVVDVPVDVALKRSKKTDKFDNETVEFFERVRETFVMWLNCIMVLFC